MAVYNVHAGHCPQEHGASGVVGLLAESVENRMVKDEMIRLLRKKTHTVYDTTCDYAVSAGECLRRIVAKCNLHEVDVDFSIHLNSARGVSTDAGKAQGVEVWLYSSADSGMEAIANRICRHVSIELGIKNRGVKYNENIYVLRETKNRAMLIECCFADSAEDYEHWNAGKCANAIVNGIFNTEDQYCDTESRLVNSPLKKSRQDKLDIDGVWGRETTKATQKMLKHFFSDMTVDGIVSKQPLSNKKYLPAVSASSWKFTKDFKGGSMVALKLQWYLKEEQDGYFGRKSVETLQKYLKNDRYYSGEIDGYMGKDTVRAWQQYLNDNVK